MLRMHRKLLACYMCALIVFLAAACKRQTPTNSAPADVAQTSERQHPESGAATVAETRFFDGSIGDALDLQMKLVRESEKLSGSYFYQKVGTRIQLSGTIDKDGNVTLEEYDNNGKQSGIFKGTWKTDADGLVEIDGSWNKPNSDKKTPFSLHQAPIEFSGGTEIIPKHIKESNKKLKYDVDVQYPQLTGSTDPNFEKFNQAARALVTRKVAEFKKDMMPAAGEGEPADEAPEPDETSNSDINVTYTVELAKDDLIAIEFAVSMYSAGAAHPNSHTEVLNFDLKNGRPLKLADLFRPGAKYVQALSSYCIQELQKKTKEQGDYSMSDDDWIKKGAAPELANYENWTITRKGIGITFDPYQVGPYAEGPQHVNVPYANLKDIVKSDSPITQFIK